MRHWSLTFATIGLATAIVGDVRADDCWPRRERPEEVCWKLRPPIEATSWLVVGGGVVADASAARPVFDGRWGGSATLGVAKAGDLRVGLFGEGATSNFATLSIAGGPELFIGAIPAPLRMFYFQGEGTFSLRAGIGYFRRFRDIPRGEGGPVLSLALVYGYRAPFSLRQYWTGYVREREITVTRQFRDTVEYLYYDEQTPVPLARYMTGARLRLGFEIEPRTQVAWQLTLGIEFEPVGSVRYLLGLY